MTDRIPAFSSEDEERDFWAEHDSADYIDWSRASRVVLPSLKPSTRSISLRLPEHMLEEIKLLANRHDVPYQSLIKLFLAERLSAERWKRSRPVRLKEEGQRYPTRDETQES